MSRFSFPSLLLVLALPLAACPAGGGWFRGSDEPEPPHDEEADLPWSEEPPVAPFSDEPRSDPARLSEWLGQAEQGAYPALLVGDANEDGVVNETDLALLDAEGAEREAVSCPAALDIDRNGTLEGLDRWLLRERISADEPLVFAVNTHLPCSFARPLVAALPSVGSDEEMEIFLASGAVALGAVQGAEAVQVDGGGRFVVAPGAQEVRIEILIDEVKSTLIVPVDTTRTPTPTPTPPRRPPVEGPMTPECPQKGAGCVALVMDLARYKETFLVTTRNLDDALRGMGCSVYTMAPQFYPDIPSDVAARLGPARTQASQAKIDAWNTAELDKAVNTYIGAMEAAEAGAELLLSLVNAHGGPKGSKACGTWAGRMNWSWIFDRGEFVQQLHGAARGRVCSWMHFDLSCHSGYSALAFAEVQNGQTPMCAGPLPAPRCQEHAAYERDAAYGASLKENVTYNWRSYEILVTLWSAARAGAGGGVGSLERFQTSVHGGLVGEGTMGLYSDQGYKACSANHVARW